MEKTEKIAKLLDEAGGLMRDKAESAGRGPVDLLWNAATTQAALLGATVRGIVGGARAPGVTTAPTDMSKK